MYAIRSITVAFLLQQERASVITAASAYEALSLIQDQPTILLSDIGMPDMDGYTLIRKIRSLSPQQGGLIPAIALTAYASELDQQLALQAGFQKHIPKPIEPDTRITSYNVCYTKYYVLWLR